jgi:Tol biopolymer transport system component
VVNRNYYYSYKTIFFPVAGLKPTFELSNATDPSPVTGYSKGRERQPQVSPDGKYVAFIQEPLSRIYGRPFTTNIEVLRTDNFTQQYDITVTEAAQDVYCPSWIRSNRVLYTMLDWNTDLVYNIDIQNVPKTSDDGIPILGREHRIWRVDMAIRSAAASPDGKRVIICADVPAYKKGRINIFRRQPHLENPLLYEYDMENRTIKPIGSGFDPVISPDGTKLAYAKLEGENCFIYVKNFKTDFDGPITHGNDAFDWMPSWSPAGNQIAFASLRGNDWNIYKINEDGQNIVQITTSEGTEWDPCWGSDGYIYFSFYTGQDWDIWRVKPKRPSGY